MYLILRRVPGITCLIDGDSSALVTHHSDLVAPGSTSLPLDTSLCPKFRKSGGFLCYIGLTAEIFLPVCYFYSQDKERKQRYGRKQNHLRHSDEACSRVRLGQPM